MNISAEKLAQIAAGADPKVVLTAEELKVYMASLEESGKAEEGEGEGDGKGGEPAAEAAKTEPEATSDVLKLTKEVGRLEVKLEDAEERLKAAEAKHEALAAENLALIAVAKVAVGNLQTALGQPKAEKATGTEVVAQFNELQAQMATRFKVGQTSVTPTKDNTPAGGVTSFRHHQPQ